MINIKSMIKKLLNIFKKHKIAAGFIIILAAAGGYFVYNKLLGNNTAQARYVLAAAQKGAIIVTVSGNGQVSALNQLDIKPKVSGDIIFAGAQDGQQVKTGDLLAQIDSQDAQKTVRDAKVNLDAAKLSLEKLQQPADQLSILQAENALTGASNNLDKLKLSQQISYQKAQDVAQSAQADLKKQYDDGFNTVANAFLDLPAVMTGLQNMLFGSSIANGQWNIDYYADTAKTYDIKAIQYRDDAYQAYNLARASYNKNFADYKTLNRSSAPGDIESLINETYDTVKNIAESVKSANNLVQFYEDKLTAVSLKPVSLADSHLVSLNTYTGKTNSHLSNLFGAENAIQTDKDAIANAASDLATINQNNPFDLAAAQASVKEKETSLAKLQAGADSLDVRSQKLTVQQRQNTLLDAQRQLADYFIRTPFDGQIAKFSVKKGDASGPSVVIATLITKQQMAELSLNEVDAAKVKIGQKATLTFDAIDGLSITGEVAGIDAIGTVTQGVVSYNVKIVFDTQDARVKPGMSVSAAIIVDSRQDVLTVANSAVKTSGGNHYVEMLANQVGANQSSANVATIGAGVISATPPDNQPVEIGLSSDTATEIVSGLKEGDEVIVRVITPTTQAAASQAPSLFGGAGNRGAGGGGNVIRGAGGR